MFCRAYFFYFSRFLKQLLSWFWVWWMKFVSMHVQITVCCGIVLPGTHTGIAIEENKYIINSCGRNVNKLAVLFTGYPATRLSNNTNITSDSNHQQRNSKGNNNINTATNNSVLYVREVLVFGVSSGLPWLNISELSGTHSFLGSF